MNELQIFTYGENKVRTIEKDGEPWFVLKDVCGVLGISKYRDVSDRLDDDEREPIGVDTLGGKQEMTCVNESGLYNVILRSDKPEAKPFRKWVTSEVLPAIRKTGTYTVPKKEIPDDRMMRAKSMLLNAKARAAKEMRDLWNLAGVEPQYQAVALNGYYDGLELPREALPASATALLDKTTIAANLGVLSKSGKPHAQAVGAIIGMLPIADSERTLTPYCRNGHDGVDEQFSCSVQDKVAAWLSENGKPTKISCGGKSYGVCYK